MPKLYLLSNTKTWNTICKLVAFLLAVFITVSAEAQNYTPNTFSDFNFPVTGTGVSDINLATGAFNSGPNAGAITLRSALKAADSSGGTHIITLGSGNYVLSATGRYSLGSLGDILARTIYIGNTPQNITINGNGPANTRITMAAAGRDRIMSANYDGVTANVITTVNGVRFQDGYLTTDQYGGAAIYAGPVGGLLETLTVNNCTFDNNICPAAAGNGGVGGAIYMFQETLNIDNCTFSNNRSFDGDAGAVFFTLYNNQGNNGAVSITNSTFTGNIAQGLGGAILITGQGAQPGGITLTVAVNNNTFTGNSTSGYGGAVALNNSPNLSIYQVHFNRFVGNTATTGPASGALHFVESSGSVNAENNWWGCNTGPTAGPCDRAGGDVAGGGTLTLTKWLQLKTTVSPNPICNTPAGLGNTATVTTSFLTNSANESMTLANLSRVIGLPVTWGPTTLGSLSAQQLTIQATGTATATFTSNGTGGTATVNTQVDNIPAGETSPSRASITVNTLPTVTNPANFTSCVGGTATFTSTITGTPAPTITWRIGGVALVNGVQVSGSTVSGQGTNTLTITNVQPGDAGNYDVVATNQCGTATSSTASLFVNQVTGGTVGSDQTICSGGDPALFTQSVASTGSGALTYQWQSSTTDCVSGFSNIGGATATTYDPPAGLLVTTFYRRVTISTLNGVPCTANSNCITVTINNVTGGTVAADQTFCTNADPALFTESAASTGSGALTYQWQSSTTSCGAGFSNIGGATGTTYDPPAGLTVTTYYRRVTTSTLNTVACTANSNCITVFINDVTAGTVGSDQTVCSGGDPAAFTVTVAATGSGALTYQWQSSTTDCVSGFSNIIGATGATYDPPAGLLVTTYYRRITTSTLNAVPCTATSNCITVTINNVTGGTVAADQTICSGGDPAAFTQTVASTGSGALTYQWQSSTTNCAAGFSNIGGATGLTYDPPLGLLVTTFYRRVTTSTLNAVACTANSNCITVTVNSVTGGTIGNDQTICTPADPALLVQSVASTGSGALTYQWQSSTTDCVSGFSNIGGATATTYDPPAGLTQTTYYRRVTTSTLNAVPCTANSNCVTVTVSPNNTITLTSAPATTNQTVLINTPITNITYSTTGATGANVTGLPAGVTGSWAANVVTISGSPTVGPGTYNYTVTLTGGCGVITANGTINVVVCSITLTSAPGTNAQSVCINTPITNITYSTTGATGATFSGLPAGVSGVWAASVVTISGSPTVYGTFNYTVTPTGGGCSGAVTATGTITINPDTWLGVTSTNWFTASNWSCGVPTATTDVTIPSGTPFAPTITGGTAQVHNITIQGGAVLTNNATLNINGGGVVANNGTYKGTGSFTGTLFNNNGGIVSPGNSPGCTSFGSGYTNGTGTELIEIAGTTPCTQYDQLQVTGTATLSGTLNVVFFGGYTPSCGESYTIMTATSVVGTFATINYPALPAGMNWSIQYNATSVVISISGSPTATATPSSQTKCSGVAITTIVLSGSPVAGTVYNWTRDNTVTVTGIAASGSGNIAGTLTNTTNAPVTVTFTITPVSGTCTGPSITATVLVNPTPFVTSQTSTICSGSTFTVTPTNGGGNTVPAGTTYSWGIPVVTGGITGGVAGSGSSITGTLNNPSNAPQTATYTVTPTSPAGPCSGATFTVTVTVNPVPNVTVPANQTYCNGTIVNTGTLNFSTTNTPAASTTYSWTNSNPAIGLAAGPQTGNSLPTFTATNGTSAPITGTITVTPVYTNASGGPACSGTAQTFTITVNPTITMNTPPNQVVCNNTPTAPVSFTSPASGGSKVLLIAADNNTWTAEVQSKLIATGAFTNVDVFDANAGTPTVAQLQAYNAVMVWSDNSFNNGTLLGNNLATYVDGGGGVVLAVFATASVPMGGTLNTPTYQVIVPLGQQQGSTQTLGTVLLPLHPTMNGVASFNGGTNSFRSTSSTLAPGGYRVANWSDGSFLITAKDNVGPSNAKRVDLGFFPPSQDSRIDFWLTSTDGVKIMKNALQYVGAGSTGTVTYNWTNNTPSIGLAASGTGNIPSFNATNATNAPVVATVSVTPIYTNGGVSCPGTPTSFTYTVNPIPNAVATPASQTICSANAITPIVLTGNVAGTVFNWTRDNLAVTGIAASGTGNISGTLTNSTFAPITVTFTITPSYTNGGVTCTGTPITATVTVNPTPDVNQPANQVVCNNSNTTAVIFSGNVAGTTFNWTNNTTSIGLAASGTGNIPSFVATNATNAPVVATVTVTPQTGGGSGTQTFNYSGSIVNWTVPPGITSIDVTANGAQGGGGGGLGASIKGTVTVTPGETIKILVGGTGGAYSNGDGGGGGGSFVWKNTGNVLLVAAGGGGGTSNNSNASVGGPGSATNTPTSSINGSGNASGGAGGNGGLGGGGAVNGAGFPAGGGGGAGWLTDGGTGALTYGATGGLAPLNGGTGGSGFNPCGSVNVVGGFGGGGGGGGCSGASGGGGGYNGGGGGNNWSGSTWGSGGGGGSFNAGSGQVNTAGFQAGDGVVTISFNAGPICIGPSKTFTYTVNPTATVNPVANQVVCNNAPTAAVNFTSPTTGGVVTYSWSNNDPSIGLATNGTGNIPSFIATNATNAPVTATITVTPSFTNAGLTCVGTPRTFTITVNPTATVTQQPNVVLCNGAVSSPISFTSPTVGGTIVYNWTNSLTSIGLGASGTGTIPSFTAVNLTNAPVVATITVTPSYTNGGVTCVGTPMIFTITVNPPPIINPVANQVVCNGAPTTTINFTTPTSGGIAVFNWTNNNTSIGLAASGTGDILSFNAINNGNSPQVATITVILSYSSGGITCVSLPLSFTITVNPTPQVNQPADQVVCSGTPTAVVNFTSPTTGGVLTYNWTNTNPSIGLAASGTGNIASFTAINNSGVPQVATITVTPSFTNGGVTCTGPSKSFTITVNPTPVINPIPSQTVCNGTLTTAVFFTGTVSPQPGLVYSWTNTNTAIGLAASGTGDILPFTGTNATNAPISGTITVIATYTNGGVSCVSAPVSFTITVNPTATVNAIANQVVCNGTLTAAINFSSPTTGGTLVYQWSNNLPSIGLAANGSGNIAPFTATNASNVPVTATITVTPVFTNNGVSCNGTPRTFTITVNPTPTVNAVANQVLCNGSNTAAVNFTGAVAGTVFNWTNNQPGIGLAASGTGNIPSFTAINLGTAPIVATITVTPSYTNGGVTCTGTPITFTITVNPQGVVNQPADQVVCNGALTTAVIFTTPNTGGTVTYNWTNNQPSIGLAASGTGNIAAFTAINTSFLPVIATITVTPTFTNAGVSCVGTPKTFTITVNPTPVMVAPFPANQLLCNGSPTAPVTFTTPMPGVFFQWTNNTPSIGLGGAGTGNIPSFIATNTGTAPVTATITVTPVSILTNCPGTPVTFTITVNPTPSVNAITNQTVCNGQTTAAVTIAGPVPGTVFNWQNNNTSIGLAASGIGNIGAFTAINNTSVAQVATITVTPVFTSGGISCPGTPVSFTITVNPAANVNAVANRVECTGAISTPVIFSGSVPGTIYNWTNSNTAIGLGASGTGNIPVFTTTNTTNGPISGTITVTPTANGCVGAPFSFTITVNPIATVNQAANQTVCNGQATAAVNFTSPTTGATTLSYAWTNNRPAIGLGPNGTGNIPSFIAINNSAVPQVATITVTPIYLANGVTCSGTPMSFTITVNPTPNITIINAPIRVCLTDTVVTLSATPAGGVWSGPGVVGNTFSASLAGTGVKTLSYTVASGAGCGATSYVNVTVNDCKERHLVFANAIRIYPNPNNGQFFIRFNSDIYKEFNVKVMDNIGRPLKEYKFTNLVYGSVIPFNLRELPAETYLLEVYNAQEKATFRFVIIR